MMCNVEMGWSCFPWCIVDTGGQLQLDCYIIRNTYSFLSSSVVTVKMACYGA